MIKKITKSFPELNILVADDYPMNLELMKDILDIMKCNVDTAEDGQEALDMHSKKTYDIIFMDCQMPVMDGYSASKKIRENEEDGEPKTTIIAVTANALSGDREKCIESGMDDYISKPTKATTIEEKLEQYSSLSKKQV